MILKEVMQERDTHCLVSIEERNVTERNSVSIGCSPTEQHRGRDKSEHQMKLGKQGALTN